MGRTEEILSILLEAILGIILDFQANKETKKKTQEKKMQRENYYNKSKTSSRPMFLSFMRIERKGGINGEGRTGGVKTR